MPEMPEYSKYTLAQLEDVYKYVNRDKFPDRFKIITDEIEKRKRDGDIQIEPKKDGVVKEQIFNKYKTFWPRFWAGFIDGLVFIPVDLLGRIVFGKLIDYNPIWVFLRVLMAFAYSILLHGYFGQTVGKIIVRIKVLDVSETKLKMRQAFLRDLIPIVLIGLLTIVDISRFIPGKNGPSTGEMSAPMQILAYVYFGWFLLEILTMMSNKKRRAFHDFIAKSVVARII